eukprot:GFUD01028422.1.p1 GENE.GFUD01028422.1~~GFUD01028422.1.p1  ORF type:complete len:564 (-),score=168.80 GFUD01028422.1:58-1749(-)
MSQSQSQDALISVRLVVVDHYMSQPVSGLDPLISDFRGYSIRKVPIIRVFGSTTAGQKACLHLHGIFPYMYVPMPSGEQEGFVYRLAASLDKAINISMQQGSSNVQHVYKAVKVSGIPMYGYHPRQHSFVKLFFYNPFMVKRAAELLTGGAVMNRVLQPHESHINMELQFMMDYNLQGMNQVHLRHVMFRQGVLHDEYDDIEPFFPPRTGQSSCQDSSDQDSSILCSPHSSLMKDPPDQRFFYLDDLDDSLKLPRDVTRQSTSELEVDAVAADILNHQDLTGSSMNPGLVALWEDERERRRKLGISDPLTPPGSPPRPAKAMESSESEKFWYERFLNIVKEKKLLDGRTDTQDSADPDATINLDRKLRPHVYAAETSDKELGSLPSATQLESHVPTLSESMLDCSGLPTTPRPGRRGQYFQDSFADQTIVDEELINASQVGSGLDDEDDDLVDLLADLATEADDVLDGKETVESDKDLFSENSQSPSIKSKSQKSSQGSAKKLSQAITEALDEDDKHETLEMSQVVWDTDDNWDDFDKTIMEDLARDLDTNDDIIDDMEDMFK